MPSQCTKHNNEKRSNIIADSAVKHREAACGGNLPEKHRTLIVYLYARARHLMKAILRAPGNGDRPSYRRCPCDVTTSEW